MSDEPLERRVAEMRRRFDALFAEPWREAETARVELLGLRAAGERLAIRVDALRGVATGHPIVRLPGASPALRGVAGWEGRPVAVFSLARLLGAGAREAGEEPWLALCRADEPVAFAFGALDGYFRVAPDALRPHATDGPSAHRLVGEVLPAPDGARGVLSLSGLLAEARRLAGGRSDDGKG